MDAKLSIEDRMTKNIIAYYNQVNRMQANESIRSFFKFYEVMLK